jgi:biopolymer transport protein ExbD
MRLFVRHPAWTTRKKPTPLRTSIDLSAFLSVMLVLLFIVMFGNLHPTHFHHSLPVDMAMTQRSTMQPAAERDDSLMVVVTRDGSIYFGNARSSPTDLPNALQDAARRGPEKTVYVKADARAKYGDVKAVLDLIRQSGLQNITFLTNHPATSTP